MLKSIINPPVVAGVTRHLMTGAGGWLVASGYADAATAELIIGGVVALAGVIWSASVKES